MQSEAHNTSVPCFTSIANSEEFLSQFEIFFPLFCATVIVCVKITNSLYKHIRLDKTVSVSLLINQVKFLFESHSCNCMCMVWRHM